MSTGILVVYEAVMESGIRVFLLAASRLVRDALTRVITRKGDIRVVGAQACTPDVAEVLLTAEHDVLVADWASTGPEVLDTVSAIVEHSPSHKSILLGMKGDRQGFLSAVMAGAKGILLEDASGPDVTAAIRAVAAGQAVCPPCLCAYVFDLVAHQSQQLQRTRLRVHLGLTRREQQLLPLIAHGFTNKEIATRLCLSEQTVKNHIHRMLQKTRTTRRLEVIEVCDAAVQPWFDTPS